MGVLLLQYGQTPSPLFESRQSGIIKIPAGTASIAVYAVTPQDLAIREEYVASLEYGYSANGRIPDGTWRSSGPGTGASDSVAGHAEDMEPGSIPTSMNENFPFVAENSLSRGESGADLAGQFLTANVTPLGGNESGGIRIAAVACAYNLAGEELIWDTSTRRARPE